MTEGIDPAIYRENMVTVDYTAHIIKVLDDAVTAMAAMDAQIQRIWDLHSNVEGICSECSEAWPCHTIDRLVEQE